MSSSDYVLIFIPGFNGGFNAHKEGEKGIYCAQTTLPKLEAYGDKYILKGRLVFEVNDSASAPDFFDKLAEYEIRAHDVKTVKIYSVSTKDDGKTKTLVKLSDLTLYNYQMKTEVQKMAGVAIIEFIVPDTVNKEEVPGIKYTTSYKESEKSTVAGPVIMINSRNNTVEQAAHKTWDDKAVDGIK